MEYDPRYVAMFMFGSKRDKETEQIALRLKKQIFKKLQSILVKKGITDVIALNGDSNYGDDVQKIQDGDPEALAAMKHKNARICLQLFIVMHDAEKGEFSFDEKTFEKAQRMWTDALPGSKTTPIKAADKGTRPIVFEGGDPAYINFARCHVSGAAQGPPCAVVAIEAPTDELSADAYEKVYAILGTDGRAGATAQSLATLGEIRLGDATFPRRRLVPVIDAKSGALAVPFKSDENDAHPELAKINAAALRAIAETIDMSKAFGCPYCGGKKSKSFGSHYSTSQFGCPYCGGKNKNKNKTPTIDLLPTTGTGGSYNHHARNARLRQLLFKSK